LNELLADARHRRTDKTIWSKERRIKRQTMINKAWWFFSFFTCSNSLSRKSWWKVHNREIDILSFVV